MEEKLVNSAFGTTHAIFRPTNLIFSHTTNNTVHPQMNCDGEELKGADLAVVLTYFSTFHSKTSLVLNYH